MLLKADEERAERLMKAAETEAERRWLLYSQLAEINYKVGSKDPA